MPSHSVKHPPVARPDSFMPIEMMGKVVHYGWLVAVLMIVGGVAGWAFRMAQPALYEAQVTFTISYDLTNMGQMTQFEQDHVSGAVGDLMSATDVLQSVVDDAHAQGIILDVPTLKSTSTVERAAQIWYIRVRNSNPQQAAEIANLWGARVDQALRAAYQEGAKAEGLQRYMDSLETCLQRSVNVEPAAGVCGLQNLPAIQQEMQSTGQALTQAKLASRAILPSLLIDWSEKAEVPRKPVLLNMGSTVFVGALLGLLLAVWLIDLNLVEKLLKRSGRA